MPNSLFQYEMLPTTWFYISGLLLIATFFRFNRFWSVRNLDIIGIILFAPGLLFIAMGMGPNDTTTTFGYLWLTVMGFFAFIRMVLDCFMIRRPLLEPNLTSSSLTFACIMLIGFMVANVIINQGEKIDSLGTLRLEQILTMQKEYGMTPGERAAAIRPGYQPFLAMTETANRFESPGYAFWESSIFSKTGYVSHSRESSEGLVFDTEQEQKVKGPFNDSNGMTLEGTGILAMIILIQLGIVLGIVLIGHCHFGNIRTGIAAAMFYLLLPYVTQMTGSIDHTIPGLLIVLAVLTYRRPLFSGVLLGLAGVLVFYPFFLLPLWGSFYYKRGLFRFLLGALSAILGMSVLLLSSPENLGSYSNQVALMFGWHSMRVPVYDGLWLFCPTIYRIPIIAFFGVFCFGLIIWPTRKNLATLISCSALVMIGVQFWMGNQGGLYMAWYLPLLILTVFRPNLEDRVASSTVVEINP